MALRPGDYRLMVGGEGGLRIPFVVPFTWRESGRDPGKETPRTVVVPMAPGDIPADRALVIPVGDTVDHRGPPFAAPILPATVGPFLMDRYEVSSGEYLEYLDALTSDAERKARVPTVGYDADPDRPGRFVLAASTRDLPVRGISPAGRRRLLRLASASARAARSACRTRPSGPWPRAPSCATTCRAAVGAPPTTATSRRRSRRAPRRTGRPTA